VGCLAVWREIVEKRSKRRGKIVIVTGIPGVGKTTVLNKVLELCSSEGVNVKVVNYGDVMLEEALRRKLVSHRDEMRKLPLPQQLELQQLAAERISQLAAEKNLIVDTHTLIRTRAGFLPGLPLWVLALLSPDVVVAIEADPREIQQRRLRDAAIRSREADVEEVIQEHQSLCRSAAIAAATITGATVLIVRNKEGKVEEAANPIASLFK